SVVALCRRSCQHSTLHAPVWQVQISNNPLSFSSAMIGHKKNGRSLAGGKPEADWPLSVAAAP
ncbi:hypothetical protein, partial [Aurantiacibacter arachoides]|uniref:hypothetical protein n=1 Tax=Aurantiacibacter arachoides TaxID=1850444 RepID=UPI001F1A5F17